MPGNWHAGFGKRPTEKDPHHGHLTGRRLHSEGGPEKPTRREPGRALRPDPYTHFSRAKRVVFAIVDMVSRKWIDTLVSVEETATQVQVVFEHALELEGLLELLTDERLDLAVDDPARPILLAVSDNGPPMAADATRAFMALMAIAQHRGRPHTPTDQAWIESFFGHIKAEWPHLEDIGDPVVLEAELARVRIEYNSVRLHEAIGYVTPDDEHEGRGEQIREARRQGLARARQQRLDHHRQHTNPNPEETP